jgi:hypothetical protein
MRAALFAMTLSLAASAIEFKDGYADSGGVKIHYVTAGQGPLVVMIHGFPDFWYTWRTRWKPSPGHTRSPPSTSAVTT